MGRNGEMQEGGQMPSDKMGKLWGSSGQHVMVVSNTVSHPWLLPRQQIFNVLTTEKETIL